MQRRSFPFDIRFRWHRLRRTSEQPAPLCTVIERVVHCKLTWCRRQQQSHRNRPCQQSTRLVFQLALCCSVYTLCTVLRSHGLPDQSLKEVFQATVIGKIMYRVGQKSLDDTIFVAKLFIVENWPDWGPKYSVACFHELQCTENRWHVYGELSFLSHYPFTVLVQRIYNCSK